MTDAERALHLVQEYKRLTLLIKACRPRIAEAISRCEGVDGKLKEEEAHQFGDETVMLPTAAANADHTHLHEWFEGEVQAKYTASAGECEHCFAAFQAIEDRRRLRRSLGGIKASMTKFGGKAA